MKPRFGDADSRMAGIRKLGDTGVDPAGETLSSSLTPQQQKSGLHGLVRGQSINIRSRRLDNRRHASLGCWNQWISPISLNLIFAVDGLVLPTCEDNRAAL